MVHPYNTECKETLKYYNHQTIQFVLNNNISICNHCDQINYKISTIIIIESLKLFQLKYFMNQMDY